jgi:RNA polymerase sigma-70 factor (ECF subfamily)
MATGNSLLDNLSLGSNASITEVDTFARLYREHTEAVFNYCLFQTGNRAVAEDLTADTFERAWRARRRYRPERAAFNTWLFTIARRVVIDWQRRQARRPLFKLREEQPGEAPSPESQIEESEQQRRLRALIRSLEPHEQEMIALKFGAAMTNREIAQLLDKSETAIGSAIHRIMQKLRLKWKKTDE